jgi:hypothetical protein
MPRPICGRQSVQSTFQCEKQHPCGQLKTAANSPRHHGVLPLRGEADPHGLHDDAESPLFHHGGSANSRMHRMPKELLAVSSRPDYRRTVQSVICQARIYLQEMDTRRRFSAKKTTIPTEKMAASIQFLAGLPWKRKATAMRPNAQTRDQMIRAAFGLDVRFIFGIVA